MLPIIPEMICDPPGYDRILYPGASDHGWISVTVPQQHYILGLKFTLERLFILPVGFQ